MLCHVLEVGADPLPQHEDSIQQQSAKLICSSFPAAIVTGFLVLNDREIGGDEKGDGKERERRGGEVSDSMIR